MDERSLGEISKQNLEKWSELQGFLREKDDSGAGPGFSQKKKKKKNARLATRRLSPDAYL